MKDGAVLGPTKESIDYAIFKGDFMTIPSMLKVLSISGLVVFLAGGLCQAQIPTNGLVAYYPFGGNATDGSGNGHNATVVNAALAIDRFGNASRAYSFDGSSQYIQVPYSNAFNFGTNSFSLSLWISAKQIALGMPLGKFLETFDWDQRWAIFLNANGRIGFHWSNSSVYDNQLYSNDSISTNRWYHIVAVMDRSASEARLYINGVFVSMQDSGIAGSFDNSDPLTIGRNNYYNNQYFNGSIDDIRIFNRALTYAEIQSLYHESGWANKSTSTLLLNQTDFWVNCNQSIGISGILVDGHGNPLSMKQINIDDPCEESSSIASTKSDGSFSYNSVASKVGVYQLNFSYISSTDSAFAHAVVSVQNGETFAVFRSVKLKNTGPDTISVFITHTSTNNQASINRGENHKNVILNSLLSSNEFIIPPYTSMTVIDGTGLDYEPALVDNTVANDKLSSPPHSIVHQYCPLQLGLIICGPDPDDPNSQEFSFGVGVNGVFSIDALYDRSKQSWSVSGDLGLSLPYVIGGSASLIFGTNGMQMNTAGMIGIDQWSVNVWDSQTSKGLNDITMNIHSPINPLVTIPDGRRIGIDPNSDKFINEIPGAVYTGPAFESQTITIPTDSMGNYNLFVEGNGTGSYLIQESSIHNGTTTGNRIINGSISMDSTADYVIHLDTTFTGIQSPNNLKALTVGLGEKLQWNSVFGATGYEIYYRVTNSGPPYNGFGIIEGSSPIKITKDTNCVLHGLIWDSTYYFMITAVDSNEVQSGMSNEVLAVIQSIRTTINVEGWELVSLPVQVVNDTLSNLFPSHVSSAFAYNGSGYIIMNQFIVGVGYWLKFASATNNTIRGISLASDTISVLTGWNLIGSLSCPLPISSITSNPPGMITSQFFGYIGGYKTSDTLYPGKGYWVKTDTSGTLILSAGSSDSLSKNASSSRVRIITTSELPPPPPNEDGTKDDLPKIYALSQCFPNPFNPTTTIKYELPTESHISLKIYNLLGQVVQNLTDGIQEAGYKSVNWNASSFASGIYFYRLDATSVANPSKTFTSVRKMLLMK